MGVCRCMHLGDWLVVIAVAVIDEDDCVAVSLLSDRIAYPICIATDANTTTTAAAAVDAVADVWIGWHVVDAREGSAAHIVIVIVALPIRLIMSHTITATTTTATAATTAAAATRTCVRLLISQEHLSQHVWRLCILLPARLTVLP